jgi:hypothetical protein
MPAAPKSLTDPDFCLPTRADGALPKGPKPRTVNKKRLSTYSPSRSVAHTESTVGDPRVQFCEAFGAQKVDPFSALSNVDP